MPSQQTFPRSALASPQRRPICSEHPNVVGARLLRRYEIEHAMKCLYRDHAWIGDLAVCFWLDRIHYLRDEIWRGWLRAARVDGLCPVDALSQIQRDRLIWQMLAFLREEKR
jgi:hypothetical protein